VLVADGSSLQKIIGIFLSFWFSDVLLDILVKSDGLVQINCFLIIEVDIVENLLQLCFLLLT
jgi:hypothetical protein